jgi:hypothetical protein
VVCILPSRQVSIITWCLKAYSEVVPYNMASTLSFNFLFISSLSNNFSRDAIQAKQLMYHYINHEPLIQGKESVHIM